MRLYSVTDGYIDYLHSTYNHVYSNKETEHTHTRKYLGAVIVINSYSYFIPLSSPKDNDYIIIDGKRIVRKDSFLVMHIASGQGNSKELKGTIRFACMIPVPESELILYDADNEEDKDYKNLVEEEIEYIRKNSKKIKQRAKAIYRNKVSGSILPVYSTCLDFKGLENLYNNWLKFVDNSRQ